MSATVEDWQGTEAPAELDGVDLFDCCPNCGANEPPVYTEYPAGYYTCDDCFSTWAGEPENASLVTYLKPDSEDESE